MFAQFAQSSLGLVVMIPIFVLFLGLMIFAHEMGHFLVAKKAGMKVEEFGFGYPPKLWGWRRGETEYTLNAIPFGGFVRVLGEEDETDPRSYLRAPKRWRFVFLIGGCVVNLAMAVVFFAGAYLSGTPRPTETEVAVSQVVAGLPAEQAGLRPGDVIVALAGTQVRTARELRAASEAVAGTTVPMQVRRDGQAQTLSVTPRAAWPQGEGPLGIAIGDRATKWERVGHSLPSALLLGAEQTGQVVVLTFTLPYMAVRGLLPWSLVRPVGPIGIYSITTQAAAETIETGWWFPVLSTAGSLAAGLGVINLLPIPALDGGRLLFLLFEIVRGRRISPHREGAIHLVGFALLISLMLGAVIMDITSPLPSLDWGSLR
jgi:regulator of sigma E protease